MPIFNGIIKSDNNSLVRKPTTSFAGIVGFPLTYAVLPYAQPNNLVGWFNNGDGITVATGVSAWVDRIAGASLAQATGSLQPTYTQQVQTINGKNKIAFASTQYMSAGDVFDIRTNTGYSASIYAKLTNIIGNRFLFGKSVNALNPTVVGDYSISCAGVNLLIGKFYDNVSIKSTASFIVDPNNYYLYTIVVDITNSLLLIYINERPVITVAISNAAVDYNSGNPFQIGSSNNTIAFDFLEALVYQVALTQAEVAKNSIVSRGKFGQI